MSVKRWSEGPDYSTVADVPMVSVDFSARFPRRPSEKLTKHRERNALIFAMANWDKP